MDKKINAPVNATYHESINEKLKIWELDKKEEYKTYRKEWAENPKKFILKNAPLHIDIEPTNACNLKCPMCPRTTLINQGSKFDIGMMKLETYKKIIDQAVEIGVYSIKLNWLGEPLVHPNIVEMVLYAKKRGIIDVMFNTNGVLLDEGMARNLINSGLDKIFFSFDSPYKEKYEEIRIGAKYEEVLHNIKTIVKLRNEMNAKSPITRVSMVYKEEDKEEYNDFVNLFQDIVDAVAYVEYRNPSDDEIPKEEYNLNFSCSQLWQRMFINWNGDVIPCCVDSKLDMKMGNIHESSISEIWNNNLYNGVRNNHKNGEWFKCQRCRKCDLTKRKEDGNY